jgi:hypothetical protein
MERLGSTSLRFFTSFSGERRPSYTSNDHRTHSRPSVLHFALFVGDSFSNPTVGITMLKTVLPQKENPMSSVSRGRHQQRDGDKHGVLEESLLAPLPHGIQITSLDVPENAGLLKLGILG